MKGRLLTLVFSDLLTSSISQFIPAVYVSRARARFILKCVESSGVGSWAIARGIFEMMKVIAHGLLRDSGSCPLALKESGWAIAYQQKIPGYAIGGDLLKNPRNLVPVAAAMTINRH